jgi:hypothetical protein
MAQTLGGQEQNNSQIAELIGFFKNGKVMKRKSPLGNLLNAEK